MRTGGFKCRTHAVGPDALEQRLGVIGIALTVAVAGLIGVACLRAFAMADNQGRFVALLTGGYAPFILFYPTMAVVIPSSLAAPPAQTRAPAVGARLDGGT